MQNAQPSRGEAATVGEPPRGLSPGLRHMAAAAFFFSLMTLFVKLAGQRLPSQEVVLGRALVGVLLSLAALRRVHTRPWGNSPRLLLLRGSVGFAALSCFYFSITRLPLADATVIQFMNPVFAALLAAWLLREKIRPLETLCVLVSLAGVVLVARPAFLFGTESARLDTIAVAVGLIGAVLSAVAYVLVRKLGETEDPMVIVFYFALVSVVASLPAVAAAGVWPIGWEWLALLAVGVATQAGQINVTHGLRLEPAARATSMGYLQVVFAALWGILFFHEYPDKLGVAGAALILGSTLALVWFRSGRWRPRRRSPTGVGAAVVGGG
jgi:drug/metabolite transporter (DMT)-like permease